MKKKMLVVAKSVIIMQFFYITFIFQHVLTWWKTRLYKLTQNPYRSPVKWEFYERPQAFKYLLQEKDLYRYGVFVTDLSYYIFSHYSIIVFIISLLLLSIIVINYFLSKKLEPKFNTIIEKITKILWYILITLLCILILYFLALLLFTTITCISGCTNICPWCAW
jgi:hypothetical protein